MSNLLIQQIAIDFPTLKTDFRGREMAQWVPVSVLSAWQHEFNLQDPQGGKRSESCTPEHMHAYTQTHTQNKPWKNIEKPELYIERWSSTQLWAQVIHLLSHHQDGLCCQQPLYKWEIYNWFLSCLPKLPSGSGLHSSYSSVRICFFLRSSSLQVAVLKSFTESLSMMAEEDQTSSVFVKLLCKPQTHSHNPASAS